MIKALRHFGIVVSSMEKSLRFYRDFLGLKIVREMDESGEYIDNMLCLKNVRVRTVKMSPGNKSALVELLEFKSPPSRLSSNHEIFYVGPSHVSFTVEDLNGMYLRLSKAGVQFNSPPQNSPDGCAKVTFCRDPDGTLIELVEVL